MIHQLSTHYGWSKREILDEVYPCEAQYYLRCIERDEVYNRLMHLSIVHNPHSKDPNHLVSLMRQQLEQQDHQAYFHKERMNSEDEDALKELSRHIGSKK